MENRVLFLCTDNSSRSQLAEALLRKQSTKRFTAFSAGLRPAEIHPLVYRVMEEIGVSIEGQAAKGIKEFLGKITFLWAIIVCEENEPNCPRIYPDALKTIRWPLQDPARGDGTEEERLTRFRQARDEIDQRIRLWLEDIPA
jgi:arsenate reductase